MPDPTSLDARLSTPAGAVRGSDREAGRAPADARLRAAARLLGDDSEEVRAALLPLFRDAGRRGRPLLRAAARGSDARARAHARSLLEVLDDERTRRRLMTYASRDELDLETGLLLLGSFDRPGLDARPYRAALDGLARVAGQRASHLRDDLQRGRSLVEFLGQELGYRGELDHYHRPDGVHLHRVIETRRGLPLTLCALYAAVARRLGLMTGIVPLPGHVMLRLYGAHQNLIVDPFHGGESRSQEELVEYLHDQGLRFNPVWMHDAGPRALLARQTANLQNAWRSVGHTGRARRLAPLLDALGR
jgi:regulator of sirC expression with transglutaminase-like and TPR domain